jgi:hypothetical protein
MLVMGAVFSVVQVQECTSPQHAYTAPLSSTHTLLIYLSTCLPSDRVTFFHAQGGARRAAVSRQRCARPLPRPLAAAAPAQTAARPQGRRQKIACASGEAASDAALLAGYSQAEAVSGGPWLARGDAGATAERSRRRAEARTRRASGKRPV